MRRVCEYVYRGGAYESDCGNITVFRPIGRCDKCGRKPQEERKDVDAVRDRTGN